MLAKVSYRRSMRRRIADSGERRQRLESRLPPSWLAWLYTHRRVVLRSGATSSAVSIRSAGLLIGGELLANSSSSHSRGTGTAVPGGSEAASSRSPAAFTCDFSDRYSFTNISILRKSFAKFLRDCLRVRPHPGAPPPPLRGMSSPKLHPVCGSSSSEEVLDGRKELVWLLGVGVVPGVADHQ